MKHILLLFGLLALIGCGNNASTTNDNATTKTAIEKEKELPRHPQYPKIPLAEKGITMTNKDGWEEGTFDFHLGYCQQMMASIENNVDTKVFCECFISKIQYYYPPTFFKEAYEDQVQWNQICYQKGAEAKIASGK